MPPLEALGRRGRVRGGLGLVRGSGSVPVGGVVFESGTNLLRGRGGRDEVGNLEGGSCDEDGARWLQWLRCGGGGLKEGRREYMLNEETAPRH